MKERVKGLLLTGSIIALITILITLAISLFSAKEMSLISISNILFIEFLILLSLSILILFKEQFKFKRQEKEAKVKNKAKSAKRLNSTLELLLIAMPLLIISGLIILIN